MVKGSLEVKLPTIWTDEKGKVEEHLTIFQLHSNCTGRTSNILNLIIEGSLEVKLPTIWTDEKQSREEAERRERLEERRVEEKE